MEGRYPDTFSPTPSQGEARNYVSRAREVYQFPCDETQWYEDVSSTIVEIARREGEEIDLPRVAE